MCSLVFLLSKREKGALRWQFPVAVLVLGGVPLVLQSSSSSCLVRFRGRDISILAKVRNEVVHWVRFLSRWSPSEKRLSLGLCIQLNCVVVIDGQVPLAILLLLRVEALQRVLNIVINAEMWNEVVSGRVFWRSRSIQNVSELPLSIGDILLGSSDFFVLAEIWHKVVPGRVLWRRRGVVHVTQLFLGSSNVLLGVGDFSTLPKVWHEVVPWGIFRRSRRINLNAELSLCCSDVALC